jgi:N-hydroxyarylamine O-acetyltransferase
METDAYLKRIGYTGSLEPTTDTLRQLHRAHMLAVPFENLDIFLGRPIVLDIASFYDKIVRHGRGGYCYELNGLFSWLLTKLGFAVSMVSARTCHNGLPGPEFDHMVLLIEGEKPMLADVGFGDSFTEPLGFGNVAIRQGNFFYILAPSGAQWIYKRRERSSDWTPQYLFSQAPRQLSDFAGMNQYHQTSPDSMFTRSVVCTRATADGRITLSKNRLIVTSRDNREERAVTNEAEFLKLLEHHFGIHID